MDVLAGYSKRTVFDEISSRVRSAEHGFDYLAWDPRLPYKDALCCAVWQKTSERSWMKRLHEFMERAYFCDLLDTGE